MQLRHSAATSCDLLSRWTPQLGHRYDSDSLQPRLIEVSCFGPISYHAQSYILTERFGVHNSIGLWTVTFTAVQARSCGAVRSSETEAEHARTEELDTSKVGCPQRRGSWRPKLAYLGLGCPNLCTNGRHPSSIAGSSNSSLS
jgi:hypothetical protein